MGVQTLSDRYLVRHGTAGSRRRRPFDVPAHYESEMFADFALPSKFRVAFFKPVGASARRFRAEADRDACVFGATVADVDLIHGRLVAMSDLFPAPTERLAKDQPWGNKRFLLTEPGGRSPSRPPATACSRTGPKPAETSRRWKNSSETLHLSGRAPHSSGNTL